MAQRLHHNEILDRMISLIDTALAPAQPTGLGLKTIAKGDISFFASPDAAAAFAAELPAVYIKPDPVTELRFRAVGKEYQATYRFRLVYVRQFTTTEKVIEEKIKDVQRLAETLIDNITLNDLPLSNAQVVLSLPSAIEWEPPEDVLVSSVNLWMVAAAIVFEVRVLTRR